MDTKNNESVTCLRCDHVWTPRKPAKYCARCKSSLWNQPRKYYSPEADALPTEKRTAATGRAAKKKKPKTLDDIYALAESDEERAAINKAVLIHELYNALVDIGIIDKKPIKPASKSCVDCGSNDNIFLSPLNHFLCQTCENKRQLEFQM